MPFVIIRYIFHTPRLKFCALQMPDRKSPPEEGFPWPTRRLTLMPRPACVPTHRGSSRQLKFSLHTPVGTGFYCEHSDTNTYTNTHTHTGVFKYDNTGFVFAASMLVRDLDLGLDKSLPSFPRFPAPSERAFPAGLKSIWCSRPPSEPNLGFIP